MAFFHSFLIHSTSTIYTSRIPISQNLTATSRPVSSSATSQHASLKHPSGRCCHRRHGPKYQRKSPLLIFARSRLKSQLNLSNRHLKPPMLPQLQPPSLPLPKRQTLPLPLPLPPHPQRPQTLLRLLLPSLQPPTLLGSSALSRWLNMSLDLPVFPEC